jgi:hypothetical protein
MALKKPLVISNGQIEQLQAGDTLDAPVSTSDAVQVQNGSASAIVIGTPVYVKAGGQADKAQANASGTVQVLGLCADVSAAAAANMNVQTDAILSATTTQWDAVAGGTGGLTPGAVYWLSAATAGKLTATAPTNAGEFVVRIGTAVSSTELEISIEAPIKL